MSRRILDAHTHWIPPSLVEAFMRRDEAPRITETPEGRFLHYSAEYPRKIAPAMTDLEVKLRQMQEAGIDFALVTVNVPGVDWFPAAEGVAAARATNDELAAAVRDHPDRIAALATLPMQAPEEAAAELERAVGLGLRGAHVYSNVAGRHIDEPELRVVFEAAAALDVPISLHPTYPLAARTLDKYSFVPVLGYLVDSSTAALRLVFDGLYERHPDFKLVLSHNGSLLPYIVGRLDYESARMEKLGALDAPPSERLRQMYTDSITLFPPALEYSVAFFGADHVVLGTDQPFWEASRSIETLEAASLDEETKAAIASTNGERLYRLS